MDKLSEMWLGGQHRAALYNRSCDRVLVAGVSRRSLGKHLSCAKSEFVDSIKKHGCKAAPQLNQLHRVRIRDSELWYDRVTDILAGHNHVTDLVIMKCSIFTSVMRIPVKSSVFP